MHIFITGWPKAHIAAAMGVSRKCVKTWITRYAEEGEAGLVTRSSRPHRMPTKTSDEVEQKVLTARAEHRKGPDALGPSALIRSSKQTAVRYERQRPGELVHMDVKKIGRSPDGGGWRVHGRGIPCDRVNGPGYDYVHSLVDDHSRLAYNPRFCPTRKVSAARRSCSAPSPTSLPTASSGSSG